MPSVLSCKYQGRGWGAHSPRLFRGRARAGNVEQQSIACRVLRLRVQSGVWEETGNGKGKGRVRFQQRRWEWVSQGRRK